MLEVSDLEEGIRSALVWKDLEQPRGIALDYESGYLFWSDWGANPRIERADMDGENRVDLITEGLGWPNGLAVDRAAKRIYWADAQMKTIESCTLSGGARTKVVENLPHPYALAVTGRTIYWTDWITKALHSVPKGNPAHIRNVTHGLEGLMDVKVVQEDEERHLENVCGAGNGGCSHLCLRNPTGYSCKCPTGLTMREGSTTDCKTLPDVSRHIMLHSLLCCFYHYLCYPLLLCSGLLTTSCYSKRYYLCIDVARAICDPKGSVIHYLYIQLDLYF